MQFKDFIGTGEQSPFLDVEVQTGINSSLDVAVDGEIFSTADGGVQKIRSVLYRYGIDIPTLEELDLDTDGDEAIIEFDSGAYLYFIYYLTDEATYEFHAEVTDDAGIEEILSDDEEEEDEE